jgi:hypothetical protein
VFLMPSVPALDPVSPLVDVIAGARPNFMKIAPILHAIQQRQKAGSRLRYRLVHTGQHHDARMSGDFFTQLGIPEPDVNLEVGSGTQAEQTASIMTRYERLLQNREIWRAMKTHQMQPALLPFVVGKLLSRGRQFLSRPAG